MIIICLCNFFHCNNPVYAYSNSLAQTFLLHIQECVYNQWHIRERIDIAAMIIFTRTTQKEEARYIKY